MTYEPLGGWRETSGGSAAESEVVACCAPIPGGGTASFFTLTVPVFADDSPVAALLTFSSPNVPLAEFLEEGFRSIAASAQLVAPSA